MKDLSEVSKMELSEELKKVFIQFPKQIEEWKTFLKGLNFEVLSLNEDYETMGDSTASPFVYGKVRAIYGRLTPDEAFEEKLVICGACFVSASQFIHNDFWPNVLEDTPKYLEIGFGLDDKAFITLRGNVGEPLFEQKKYFSSQSLSVGGTWLEIAEIIISIMAEITGALKLVEVPAKKI